VLAPATKEFLAADELGGTLSAALAGWIDEATALAEAAALPATADLVTELTAAAAQRARPGFRLAVVGEFNRGKSTLINLLVGEDLLETGPVPTTAAFVVVGAGTGLEESTERGDRRLQVPCAWLSDADVELVDTPGTNEALADRTADVRRAVALSDGVLFTVTAGTPFTRTERELLDQEVLRRGVGLLAVVVTHLDQLSDVDRDTALASIGATVARLAPGTPVLPGPQPGGGDAELTAIRRVITGFARRCANDGWRDRKIATTVADVTEAMADVARHTEAFREAVQTLFA